MNYLDNHNIWQVSAGDSNRNYVDICIKYQVILNGNGNVGDLRIEKNIVELNKLRSEGKFRLGRADDIYRFKDDIKDGDIVALKTGRKRIYAIGKVIGEYEYNNLFSDIDGWDMNHVRRVNWIWICNKGKDGNYNPKIFENIVLNMGTTYRLPNVDVLDWIKSLDLDLKQDNELGVLPEYNSKTVKIEEISEYLYSKGVSSVAIENLVSVIDDLQMIAKWYWNVDRVSEFETESYLIIPLMRALGWSPQKMAIEWNRIDIALFDKLPREDDNLIAVLEAKRKGDSCLTAQSQAYSYAKDKSSCNRLIVSDGLRYGIFIKGEETKNYELHAYMNLVAFKDKYEIYACEGIKEALWSMTPDWHYEK